MARHRFLLVIYPAQGHLNPALQFAKRLITMDVHVTLAVTVHMYRRMANKPSIPGLTLAPFSDGYDDGMKAVAATEADYKLYASGLKRRGSEFITNLISSRAKEGHPFTCVTYTLVIHWAHEVARGFHLPSALLWIEPATVFDIFYYYFHGYDAYINEKSKEKASSSSSTIALPGLPLLLSPRDLPTFLSAGRPSALSFFLSLFEEQFQELDKEINPTVLVNTFEALEPEALRAVDGHGINMIPIGPLIPSAYLDGRDPTDTSFGGDLMQGANGYAGWLESQAGLSVVYVSFGSFFELSKRQMEEIARALLDCGRPFLWVVRDMLRVEGRKEEEEELISCIEELEMKGKLVKWCSQVEVLSHPSLGCFVTHCGWNSTMESLVSGVPVVAFPQWSDQKTNAKLIEEVWKTGVRVDHDVDEEGVVKAEEIRRCLDVVMGNVNGERGNELRRNANKWKILAKEAAKEGGPSEMNLKTFLDDVGQLESE